MRARLGLAAILGAVICGFAIPSSGQIITEFPIPTAASGVLGLTVGPDGNIWFTEQNASNIGRITTAGALTEFPLPAGTGPTRIHGGPDGNLWFSENARAFVGRLTTAGVLTEFALPNAANAARGITSGPDGNVWFAENPGNRIGHTGGAGASFAIPTAGSGPAGINAGPDGNIWFTEFNGNNIGRITPAGVISEFPIPTAAAGASGISSGPGGKMWFIEKSANRIGAITTAGLINEFPIPSGGDAVVAGVDGNLWFTEDSGKIGRMTPAGAVTEFPIPSGAGSSPSGLISGPDGNLWFAENGTNKIGKITPGAVFNFLPVLISSPGVPPSFFKTSIQINNPTGAAISGLVLFHPGGTSGSSADPGGNYNLAPRQTMSYDDVLPAAGLAGVFTFDVFAVNGPPPVGVVRVFNDAGAAGTTGFNEDFLTPQAALVVGQRAILVSPSDTGKFRFNIGVRTLTLGACITITVRDTNGATTQVVPKCFPATFFQQAAAADFLGAPLAANASLDIVVDTGSLIIYGATADNITQDPSLQLARRVS